VKGGPEGVAGGCDAIDGCVCGLLVVRRDV